MILVADLEVILLESSSSRHNLKEGLQPSALSDQSVPDHSSSTFGITRSGHRRNDVTRSPLQQIRRNVALSDIIVTGTDLPIAETELRKR